jgi:hypothetical protein
MIRSFEVSFDWFLPNGIGKSASSRRSGALSCATRIFGAGRELTDPRGCYDCQNRGRETEKGACESEAGKSLS